MNKVLTLQTMKADADIKTNSIFSSFSAALCIWTTFMPMSTASIAVCQRFYSKEISMKWILELQQLLLPEEEPDDGGSTISIAFVCKKESTISLLFCMDR